MNTTTATTTATATNDDRCPSCGARDTDRATPGCTDSDGCNG